MGSCPVVVEPGLGVELAAGEEVAVRQGVAGRAEAAQTRDVAGLVRQRRPAVGGVVDPLHHGAVLVGDRHHVVVRALMVVVRRVRVRFALRLCVRLDLGQAVRADRRLAVTRQQPEAPTHRRWPAPDGR
jgi:hypothetical protein